MLRYFQCENSTWSIDMDETGIVTDGDITKEHPKTLSVPEAGRTYFNLGRNASYAAAARGDIPTMRIGRLLRAPVGALERRLEQPHGPLSERGDDLYEAPPLAVQALLGHVRLPHGLWDPCGTGNITNVLRAAGHQVEASDIANHGPST